MSAVSVTVDFALNLSEHVLNIELFLQGQVKIVDFINRKKVQFDFFNIKPTSFLQT